MQRQTNVALIAMHRAQPFLLSLQIMDVLQVPKMGLSIQLSAGEGRKSCPLLSFPIDSLWICTSVGAKSISITTWFSSLKQKKINITKKDKFLLSVIWTGSLDFPYYQHYSQL